MSTREAKSWSRLALASFTLSLSMLGSGALAQSEQSMNDALNPCGPIANAYGPFDYRTQRSLLVIVDQYHFTPLVENLIKPMFQFFGPDLDYTLRASPNHHRALITLSRLSMREKTDQPKGSPRTVDCYFDRAMRFASDDLMVRMIYADWLIKVNRTEDAIRQVDFVTNLGTDNPMTQYNLGLLYLEAKAYDKAVARAQAAAALGYPRQELRNALVTSGKWVDPPKAGASQAASATEATGSAAAR